MTKEELMQFLKDNLRVDVNVIRPLYDDGGPYVRVTLYLGNEEITSAEDCMQNIIKVKL